MLYININNQNYKNQINKKKQTKQPVSNECKKNKIGNDRERTTM